MGITFHSQSQKKKTFSTCCDRAEILTPKARYLIPENRTLHSLPGREKSICRSAKSARWFELQPSLHRLLP